MRPKTQNKVTPLPPLLTAEQCLAKTRNTAEASPQPGRSVIEHCRIVGAVALKLLEQLPLATQQLFPSQADRIALVHDIGKVCPTFQKKIYEAAHIDCTNIPCLRHAEPTLESQWGGHATVSQATLHGCNAPEYVAEITGQHHGKNSPFRPFDYEAFGGTPWHELRRSILELILEDVPENSNLWPNVESREQARLLAGLTIVADWIGSGEIFDDPSAAWEPLVDTAVQNAGFTPISVIKNQSFEDIFSFSPFEAQQKFFSQVDSPGIYVFEAPMGMGKTEAALFAAYQMLNKDLSSGIYFALPTQLTSNRIYSRFNDFLSKILPSTTPHHARLLHGKAWLAPFMLQEMGVDAAPNGSWFSGKKGILAPFAVGTIDQALMAVMRVKHGAIRAYGLVGKVVILDEVHSYDGYTGTILDALVKTLRHYGCTVIILSATLTAQRRSAFTHERSTHTGYPLVSVSKNNQKNKEIPCTAPKEKHIFLHHCHDDTLAVEEALLRAEQGQQVLWLENTVKEAQERYQKLAARAASMDIEVGIIHSRFTASHRATHEEYWTLLYGKQSETRQTCGRILIGTQVLEQSLDIDADFLLTQFCPTDMLLQRLGRLWRHDATIRPTGTNREAWLLHPSLEAIQENSKKAWGSSAFVYAPYILYRSLLQWHALAEVTLPADIRPLLEATYAEQEEHSPAIQELLCILHKEKETLESLALRGLANDDITLSDENASTRAQQRKEADVLLLKEFSQEKNGVTHLLLADNTTLTLHSSSAKTWSQKQHIAAELSRNIVRVPEQDAPTALLLSHLKWLSPWLYCGDHKHNTASLRVALIAKDNSLQSLLGLAESKKLVYTERYGYKTL